MAEIIPFEPDPDNAGVGMNKQKPNLSHILQAARGYGFYFAPLPHN